MENQEKPSPFQCYLNQQSEARFVSRYLTIQAYPISEMGYVNKVKTLLGQRTDGRSFFCPIDSIVRKLHLLFQCDAVTRDLLKLSC